jgi:hypothetical protein
MDCYFKMGDPRSRVIRSDHRTNTFFSNMMSKVKKLNS